jgi:hypothetical protein
MNRGTENRIDNTSDRKLSRTDCKQIKTIIVLGYLKVLYNEN